MEAKPARYIKVDLDLAWGFSVRKYVASKSRESYLLPPPTTLIGALSYGYAMLRKLPEEINGASSGEVIRNMIRSVNIKVNAQLIQYSDLSRIWWYREREKVAKIDAVSVGKIFRGATKAAKDLPDMEVVYFLKDSVEDSEAKRLMMACHSIVRVGSSHGLVSVRKVSGGTAIPVHQVTGRTNYSFWADLVKQVAQSALIQLVVDPSKSSMGDYTNAAYREHVYPFRLDTLSPEPLDVEIDQSRAVLYDVGGELVVVER